MFDFTKIDVNKMRKHFTNFLQHGGFLYVNNVILGAIHQLQFR